MTPTLMDALHFCPLTTARVSPSRSFPISQYFDKSPLAKSFSLLINVCPTDSGVPSHQSQTPPIRCYVHYDKIVFSLQIKHTPSPPPHPTPLFASIYYLATNRYHWRTVSSRKCSNKPWTRHFFEQSIFNIYRYIFYSYICVVISPPTNLPPFTCLPQYLLMAPLSGGDSPLKKIPFGNPCPPKNSFSLMTCCDCKPHIGKNL